MSDPTTDQPVGDTAPAASPGVDTTPANDAPDQELYALLDNQDDRPAGDDQPTESETEEVDYEGQKFKVPKAIKDALLRQADYTRKTQEVAEQRKAVEQAKAEVQQQVQAQQAFVEDYAQVASLQRQLSQYADPGKPINWEALRTYDAANGTSLAQDALILQNQLQQAQYGLGAKIAVQREEQQRATAKQLEERDATLAKEIRNWSPETRGKLEELAGKFGFSKEELNTSDARAFKLLHRLHLGEQAISQVMKTRSLQAAASTQPAQTVRGAAPAAKDPDKMAPDEWLKWRNQQVAAQRKKAG